MGRIKISQLPPLHTGSAETELVGNYKGTTYRISLSEITSSIVQMLSESVDYRLDLLENFEADYNQMSASFVSIEQLNQYTQSADNRFDGLDSISASYLDFTQSYYSDSSSIDNRLYNLETADDIDNYATTSSFNDFTQSYSTDSASFDERLSAATNEQDLSYLVTTSSFNNFTQSQVELNATWATTGSNIFYGEQTISGSLIPMTDGVNNTSSFSLGSITNAWQDIWVSKGTIHFIGDTGDVRDTLSATADGLEMTNMYVTDRVNISGSLFVDTLTTNSETDHILVWDETTKKVEKQTKLVGIDGGASATIYGSETILIDGGNA